MERYFVKKLAGLAGVSVRTLHLYDQLGLLKPAIRTEKKYRMYGKAEAFRLQQILFYRELEMPLKDIAEILDDPQFNTLSALELHKKELQQRKARLDTLLQTIDKTIDHLKNKAMLSTEELYEGLPKETAEAWRKEANEKWDSSVERSEYHLRNKTKQDFEFLKEQASVNVKKLLNLVNEDPASEKVQKEIATNYEIIREFWGTAGIPDKQAKAYAGLGDLYVNDERYTSQEGKPNPEFAQFMNKAIKHFARQLK
ncbi:MerR family transcriptional regulator [Adhaeribacter radiodurans]|uniref:MerR family transcriptional regulator n=1 Tax=Adhaeribacter radiodurans TaxID=2745197 RepID=A0A7L7L8X2_9BACT|nr:MerR family transcriptional regulator [Adhaeribacter radiodurans]QMU29267.1 MerR family transcriptional regulator [Adhaeribacter radiodurans]